MIRMQGKKEDRKKHRIKIGEKEREQKITYDKNAGRERGK